VLGWGLLLALVLVCVWAGITVLIAWITGRWPRQL
jgi:Flp pilus assembly pilin Flp